MTWIKENQKDKDFPEAKAIIRQFPSDNAADIMPESSMQMPVTRAKGVLGIKGDLDKLPTDGREFLRFKNALNLLFQMLFGNTSANYLRLFDDSIIEYIFGFEVNLDPGFCFSDFS